MRARWARETYQGIVSTGFRVKKKLFSGRSAFQKVEVFETVGHGRMLFIDGMAMLSERDESVYHEMIAHVPLFSHPRPKDVLVIGGGDGGTVREVLKHRTVSRVTLVEIDGMVVDACRKFIPSTAGKLSDRRVTVRIEDGLRFARETKEKFDAVIVDSTEPVGPAAPLFGPAFYKDVARILTPRGIVVSQAGSPFYELKTLTGLVGILRSAFKTVRPYLFTNLTYPGGLWAFTFASQGPQAKAPRRSALRTYYYNPGIHQAAFELPEFLRRSL